MCKYTYTIWLSNFTLTHIFDRNRCIFISIHTNPKIEKLEMATGSKMGYKLWSIQTKELAYIYDKWGETLHAVIDTTSDLKSQAQCVP